MSRFGSMVHLSEDGEYKQVYQKCALYLERHFNQLPKFDLYYDAEGELKSENKDHQIVSGGLVVVDIQGGDAIGLLCNGGNVEMDAVGTRCKPELCIMYGYRD